MICESFSLSKIINTDSSSLQVKTIPIFTLQYKCIMISFLNCYISSDINLLIAETIDVKDIHLQ